MAETGLKYLHPSIPSTISSTQTTYDTATGVITAFQADAFEKGPDNEIGYVTTKDEFIFKYGKPNYTKYGQTAYNVINWLEAGGQAFIMRVLPDDASFAHAILNVQTKVNANGKSILNADGEVVKINDVSIRPTTAFVKKNNVSAAILENELFVDRSSEDTVDGYANNFLMLVYPNGRGESYNSLGFRITLNTSYDFNNSFRVYNFEVVEFDDNGSVSSVEGPFYVTFDPNSISDNRESMFIEDVINKQSKYFNVRVNSEVFASIASQINPDVDPASIDILTGQSKVSMDGQAQTYFDSTTKKYEDVHVSLHQYNSNGEVVKSKSTAVLNIPSSEDYVQEALISLDNSLRENKFNYENNKLAYMKEQFPKLRSTGFTEFKLYVTNVLDSISSSVDANMDNVLVTSLYKKCLDAQVLFEKPDMDTESNFNAFVAASNAVATEITNILNEINKLSAAYSLTEHDSPNASLPADFNLHLNNVNNLLNNREEIGIFAVQHKAKIYAIQEDIIDYQLGTVSGDYLEGLGLVLSEVEGEINYIHHNLLSIAYGSIGAIPSEIATKFNPATVGGIVNEYNEALNLLSDIRSGYMSDTSVNRDSILATANNISNELLEIITDVIYQSSKNGINGAVGVINSSIAVDAQAFSTAINTMITPSGTYTSAAILDNARTQIEVANGEIVLYNSKFFNTSLINFNSFIKLILGSDGSFAYDSSIPNNKARTASIKNQLIKAYSGALNPDLLNTDLYRFRVVLDAAYDPDIKKAIADLARTSRGDFLFFADTNFAVSPEDALEWKRSEFNLSSEFVPMYTQDLTYYDEYTGRDVRFTPTYKLATKIPLIASQFGLHYPIAGNRRGVIDDHKAISWVPNAAHREKLYSSKINYIQQDSSSTRFNSQLTSLNSTGPLSYTNNMFTILDMKQNVEAMLSNYQFEFDGNDTYNVIYSDINSYLSRYTTNRSCESVTAEVISSDYDKSQRIIRVNITIKFVGIIERIVLNLTAQN